MSGNVTIPPRVIVSGNRTLHLQRRKQPPATTAEENNSRARSAGGRRARCDRRLQLRAAGAAQRVALAPRYIAWAPGCSLLKRQEAARNLPAWLRGTSQRRREGLGVGAGHVPVNPDFAVDSHSDLSSAERLQLSEPRCPSAEGEEQPPLALWYFKSARDTQRHDAAALNRSLSHRPHVPGDWKC